MVLHPMILLIMLKKLNNKKFKKLINEIKYNVKDIDKQKKQFDKTFEKIVKTQKKFEKQLAQLKRKVKTK